MTDRRPVVMPHDPRPDHAPHPTDRLATDSARLLAAALDTAARGWPVFPLRPGTKRPALHHASRCPATGPCAGGHAGWEQRATTDPDRIRRAWAAGAFNVGLPCGRAGLVIVDLDMPDPGDPADTVPPVWAARGVGDGAGVLAWLAHAVGEEVPATRTVATPRGGRHLYFLAPTGAGAPVLRNTAGDRGRGLGWKVDTRAHGGYVVAPGSATPDGVYRLADDRDPAPLPTWLARRLTAPPLPPVPTGSIRTAAGRISRYLHAAITAETARVTSAPAGQRNASLYVAAIALGQLVAGGALSEPDARAVLRSAAAGHVALGAYNPHQAEQTITSGLRAGAKRPRTITDPAGAAA
ncbi:MAG: bifunctional DNA primase/polymerase [Dehalococcoidia bacterium]